jgi:hypothetical protein
MPMAEPAPLNQLRSPFQKTKPPNRKEIRLRRTLKLRLHPRPMPSVSLQMLKRRYEQHRRKRVEQERKRNGQKRTHRLQGILRRRQNTNSQMLKLPERQLKRPADRLLEVDYGSG